jgi:uncharacterized membrane protein
MYAEGAYPRGREMVQVGNGLHSRRSRFGDVAVVVFLLTQALDGVLTYVGVRLMGLHMEANPLLAWLMAELGSGAALTSAKVLAGGFGIILHLSCVHRVVAALAAFYVVVAILPWMALLYFV